MVKKITLLSTLVLSACASPNGIIKETTKYDGQLARNLVADLPKKCAGTDISNTYTIPAGKYPATYENDDGIFFLADEIIWSNAFNSGTPQRGGLFRPFDTKLETELWVPQPFDSGFYTLENTCNIAIRKRTSAEQAMGSNLKPFVWLNGKPAATKPNQLVKETFTTDAAFDVWMKKYQTPESCDTVESINYGQHAFSSSEGELENKPGQTIILDFLGGKSGYGTYTKCQVIVEHTPIAGLTYRWTLKKRYGWCGAYKEAFKNGQLVGSGYPNLIKISDKCNRVRK